MSDEILFELVELVRANRRAAHGFGVRQGDRLRRKGFIFMTPSDRETEIRQRLERFRRIAAMPPPGKWDPTIEEFLDDIAYLLAQLTALRQEREVARKAAAAFWAWHLTPDGFPDEDMLNALSHLCEVVGINEHAEEPSK